MPQRLTIRASGNLIDLSPDGKSALPEELKAVIEPNLIYTYVKQVYGQRGRPTKPKLIFEKRRLYRYDNNGRLVCGKGLLNKIKSIAENYGAEVLVVTKDPAHLKPDRYDQDLDLVRETFIFRPRQEECLEVIAKSDCGIIDAVPGFGKGELIAMMALLYPKAKIDVVTVGKDLIEKTVRKLRQYLPSVGQVGIGQNYRGRITVYSADSLHLSEGTADFLIVDEAHLLMAPSYGPALAKYRFSRNFAFTATPTGRMDRADAKMESLFGPVIFKLAYDEAVELGLVVPIRVEWVDAFCPNPVPDKTGVSKKRWGIWRNKWRNELIAEKVRKYMNDQVLILVATIEHALYLRKFLPEFQLCYDTMKPDDKKFYVKHGLMDADEEIMTPQRREEMRLAFEDGKLKHVIATSVWATGVSFDALPVMVWAAGGSSEIKSTQVPGRVSRIHEASGKKLGILIDCCDQFDDGFCRQADVRCRHYKKHGWENTYEDGRKTRRKRVEL